MIRYSLAKFSEDTYYILEISKIDNEPTTVSVYATFPNRSEAQRTLVKMRYQHK